MSSKLLRPMNGHEGRPAKCASRWLLPLWRRAMTDLDRPFVLRNPARKFTNVLWLFFIVLSVLLIISRPGAHKIVAAVSCAVFVVFVLSLRSGVRRDLDGVVSLDESGRRRVPWAEIDHFEERGLRGIRAVKRSGRWVRLTYYATLGDVSPEKATAMLEGQRQKVQEQKSRRLDENH